MNVGEEAPLSGLSIVEELLRRAREGDERALEALFQRSRNLLERWASKEKRRLPGGLRPSDVAQEAALRAHKGFATFQGSSGAQWHAWLKEIFLNHVAQSLRDAGRQKREALEWVSLDPSEPPEVQTQDRSPSQNVARQEQWRLLLTYLTQLPFAQKEAIRLCHLEGWPVARVAARMGRTPDSVSSLIQRGMKTLRNRMAGESAEAPGEETSPNEVSRALLQYLERRDRGESLSPEAFAGQYPSCAEELRVMFHWIEQLRALRPPLPT